MLDELILEPPQGDEDNTEPTETEEPDAVEESEEVGDEV